MRRYRCLFIGVGVFIFSSLHSGRWSFTGFLNVGRSGHMSAGLTDGREMVLGGLAPLSAGKVYEVFDLGLGEWVLDSLPERSDHKMAMLLPNGEVLYLPGGSLYLYNPESNSWRESQQRLNFQERQCATLLKNGEVLLVYNGASCYVYDCWTDNLRQVGRCNISHDGCANEVLLPSGEVLLIGGDLSIRAKCELYNPTQQEWSFTDSLSTGRQVGVSVLLRPPWDKVLVAGGRTLVGRDQVCELYDIGTREWRLTDSLNEYPREVPAMALLPDGRAMITGGEKGISALNSCEIYDPDKEEWSFTDPMLVRRTHHSLSILPTGKVLAVGDYKSKTHICEVYDPSNPFWRGRSEVITGRKCHTVTILPIIHTSNCSTSVLIVGGEDEGGGVLSSCEIFNYMEGSCVTTQPLNTARTLHCAVLLSGDSGEVLVVGGKDSNGNALVSCEKFNVRREEWDEVAPLTEARFNHSLTLLKDGRVFAVGGEGSSGYLTSSELFDGSGWSSGGNLGTERSGHCAVLLLDGRVMVIGGKNSTGVLSSCEIWDGTSWSSVASMNTPRELHTAVLLSSGKVLVIGGRNESGTPLKSCEIYDPNEDRWEEEGELEEGRYAHNANLFYSGVVVVSGGVGVGGYVSTAEIWDICAEKDTVTGKHSWKSAGEMGGGRAYHSSVVIPAERPYILTIGGTDGSNCIRKVEVFDVGLGYRAIWQNIITNYPAVTKVSNPMRLEGELFRGLSEADGGNYCHIVSNDHPITALLRVGGGNWQGNGGGVLLHMPHSRSWDEGHTEVLPKVEEIKGYYRLWIIVNGIPTKWYEECYYREEKSERRGVRVYATLGGVVYVKGMESIGKVEIYDCIGRVVRVRKERIRDGVKIENIPNGIYFYKIEIGEKQYRGKLVIVK